MANILMRAYRSNTRCYQKCFLSLQINKKVLYEKKNDKVILTLNRPEKLNTLNLTMVNKLYKHLKAIQDNSDLADLVILKANGRAFCAGGDVVAVVDSYKAGTSLCSDFFSEEYKVNHLLRTLKIPFVALIHGITMGGGVGISINGRFQVATEQTIFSMPETALGLFPDVGGTYFLSHLKNELGLFLGLTGYKLRGADVYHSGLISHYILSERLSEVIDKLLKLPKNNCTFENVDTTLKNFLPTQIPPFSLEPYLEEIHEYFKAESLEEVISNLERSKTEFAKKQLNELKKMSPTSLKVTFHQIRLGSSLNYEQVIPIEKRLTERFLSEHDFHEGCRAILKDKDRNPQWKPSKIEDVKNDKIEWYFSP